MSGFQERLTQRQNGFKKGVDADDARRKREDAAVQLRKQVREEALQKKRFTDGQPQDGSNMLAPNGAMQDQLQGDTPANVNKIWALYHTVCADDAAEQFRATQQLRKILSVEHDPPIQEVIGAGVVPRMVQFLRDISRPDLQFEAAWVLTNVASGTAEQTRAVVEQGALPLFVELLQSPSDDVREQAVWALGNIAGDCPNYRDLVLQSGGLSPVLKVLCQAEKTSLTRNATWTLSNLCRGKPPPPFEWVSPALTTLSQLIFANDVEVLTDACWALSYLSDGPSENISAVIQAGVVQRLIALMVHESPLVQTPALRTVGNIVTGDDLQTQAVLQCGALPHFQTLLFHQKKAIRKESCWVISNITAGNREQIQDVINNGLIPPVLQLFQTADFDIKREAAWVISNITAGGAPQQIEYLVESGCLTPIVDLLSVSDVKIVTVALETIGNILRVGKQQQEEKGLPNNPIVALVEQADGLSKIEALQEDPNEDVYDKAVKILENYFPLEEDGALDAEFPHFNNQFQFGAQVPQGGFNFDGQVCC